MATNITIDEAQSKLREIIAGLAPNEEVVITDNRLPVAKLVGERPAVPPRPGPGLCKGMIMVVADDEEHLDDFKEYMP